MDPTYARCPYLGKADDRNSFYHQATRRHRCYRWDRPQLVRRQDQEQYCLTSLNVSCPRHTDPSALPVPQDPPRRRRSRPVRLLGMPVRRFLAYTLPMVLLFVAAIGAAGLLLQQMTTPPLPTVLAVEATLRAANTPTPRPTAFPTWTPVVTDTATPLVLDTTGPVSGTAVFVSPFQTPGPPSATTPTTGGGHVAPTPLPPVIYATQPPIVRSTAVTPIQPTQPSTTYVSPVPGMPRVASPIIVSGPTEAAGDSVGAFVVLGEPVKTLEPGGVDVCAKVYGRVFSPLGINMTQQVVVAATWWPDHRLTVGEEGSPPINPDGTFEFCLSPGQFTISVDYPKATSQLVWIDTDEPNFTGKVIVEINFQLVN